MSKYNIELLEKEFSENFNSPLFSVLAEEYFKIKAYNKCKKVLEIGLLLNPDDNDGKFILSKIELLENNIDTAQNILNSIIKSDPLYANAIKLQIEINNTLNKGTKSLESQLSLIVGAQQDNKDSAPVNKKKKVLKTKPKKRVLKTKSPKLKSKVKATSSKTKVSTKKKSKSVKVASKMNTLTMVKILMNQGHYNQSLSMLDELLANGTISNSKFKEVKVSINKLKSKQKK